MLTVAPDGSDLRILDTCGVTSHFIWRDPSHILAWSLQDPKGGFCLFEDKTGGKIEPVFTAGDGHCTYLPGNAWILCDTYPDRHRNQNVYLYHVSSGRRVPLGHFFQAASTRANGVATPIRVSARTAVRSSSTPRTPVKAGSST